MAGPAVAAAGAVLTLASFAAAAFFVAVAMSGFMRLAAAIERRTGNSGWIDVVWTFGLGTVGVTGALLPFGAGPWTRRLLVAALASAWALRLGLHIAGRTRGIGDDPRYARMKRDWGSDAPRRLARLLQMQALVSIPLGLGIVLAAQNPAPGLSWSDLVGVALFAIGLIGGAIADGQLRAYARSGSGSGGVCDRGLWSWSRHPNYFFECVLWCSYAAIALAAGYPWGWLGLLAPACITLLLSRISGIPPLEEHMLAKHGEAYRAYQKRTSALIPLPPKGPRT
jgi:steroid 5-alpha reductase family enzyme